MSKEDEAAAVTGIGSGYNNVYENACAAQKASGRKEDAGVSEETAGTGGKTEGWRRKCDTGK